MRKRILMIEDEEDLCKEVSGYLGEQGYLVTYALDGVEGLAKIEKELPNLLLLDLRMPNMDGMEVLDHLAVRFPNLIVVVLSAFLDSKTTAKAIGHGAALCMDKPFKLEDLHERVVIPLIGNPI